MPRTKYLKKRYTNLVALKFPNFCKTGSIKGMKEQFYGKDALLVRCGAYIYNVTSDASIYYNLAT